MRILTGQYKSCNTKVGKTALNDLGSAKLLAFLRAFCWGSSFISRYGPSASATQLSCTCLWESVKRIPPNSNQKKSLTRHTSAKVVEGIYNKQDI